MKIGIIIDSSAGLTKKETNEKGWGFLPLIFNIDGKDYQDGIDIDAKKFYEIININQEVRTSATPPALILDEFEKMSKEYDQVIVYGLSGGLSSQTSNLMTFAKEFDNVNVVSSQGVGYLIQKDIQDILEFAKTNDDIKQIMDFANELAAKQHGIAMPLQMDWLVKGGRVSKAAASLARLFKIVPMIAFTGGKLDKHGKGKEFTKTTVEATKWMKENSSGEFFIIYHGANENIDKLQKEIEAVLGQKVEAKLFPPVISIHTGPGVVAVIGRK